MHGTMNHVDSLCFQAQPEQIMFQAEISWNIYQDQLGPSYEQQNYPKQVLVSV